MFNIENEPLPFARIAVSERRAVATRSKRNLSVRSESGNRLAQGGDFDGAINAFGKAIELDPKSDAAYLARGNARLKKK